MRENVLVELDRELSPPPERAGLEALEAWKRSLHLAGQEYARVVQQRVRSLLGAADQFQKGWELCRREVLAGHAAEVQRLRDRFLRAFEERLALLREAHELVLFASRVAGNELPEAQELKAEIASLAPLLESLSREWQSREDLERLAAGEQAGDRIVRTPDVCGGDARVKGTRLSVWGLEEWRRLGWSDAQILDAYPQLKPEDLAAAWAYVAQHPEEIEGAIRENQGA
jgi:uncharacterized protein (DUF433 family)